MFIYPVPLLGKRLPVISSHFREENRPSHVGVDIMYKRLPEDGGPPGKLSFPLYARRYFMPFNIPAFAFAAGVVSIAKQIGTGGYVQIDHGSGLKSEYMHLTDLKVKTGQKVSAGIPVGLISNNPIDTDPNHLHFQIKKNGSVVDPEPYLAQAQKRSAAGIGTLVFITGALVLFLSRIGRL